MKWVEEIFIQLLSKTGLCNVHMFGIPLLIIECANSKNVHTA